MFFSSSNTEQASPKTSLAFVLASSPLLPTTSPPKDKQTSKGNRAHGMSLNSQPPQDGIFAAFVAGVEKGSGKKRRKWERSFPFASVLLLTLPSPPPPPDLRVVSDVSDAILWTATKLSLDKDLSPSETKKLGTLQPLFLAFFMSRSSLLSESLEQAKDNHKVFRNNKKSQDHENSTRISTLSAHAY